MNPIVKNVLAIIIGVVVGSIVNMALIQVGYKVFPLPGDPDVSDMDQLKEAMNHATAANYLFPFFAHALGTLVGAFVAAKMAATRPMTFAYVIGFWFLVGGITVSFLIPSPAWFIALDLIVAYLPMAWLGGKLANRQPAATA